MLNATHPLDSVDRGESGALPHLAAADEVSQVLAELETRQIRCCVLRGADQITVPASKQEIDLLVDPADFRRLKRTLLQLGFVRLRSWGHNPHHFFVRYDERTDRWLKIDVVTCISYGRPLHSLRTALGDACLARRRRGEFCYMPAPDDELVTLLLHCIVDRGDFAPHWRRLKRLQNEIGESESRVVATLENYWPDANAWKHVGALIERDQWDELLSRRQAVVRHLERVCGPVRLWQEVRDRMLRKANRLAELVRPQSLQVALLAPDGAGKSTIAADLAERFYFPVRRVYMGLYPPGKPLLQRSRIPGLGLIRSLLAQWQRYLAGVYHRARGRFVVYDRYCYDSLLPSARPLGRLSRIRRWLLGHALPAPDLVVVLDAPGEVLFARKGEHSAAHLETQRRAYLDLSRRFKRAAVIDAAADADQVRRCVTAQLWRCYAAGNGCRDAAGSPAGGRT